MSEPRLRHALPRTTERQWEVAELVALGYSNGEIAEQLRISVAGVKYHVSELFRRLDVQRRDEISSWYRSERVVRGTAVARSVFEPWPIPAPLQLAADAAGWPSELLIRAQRLRVGEEELARWLRHGPFAEYEWPHTANEFEQWLRDRELLMFGTLRSRVASAGDNEALAGLYERSSESLGDSDLYVERSPHVFAQFRLLDEFHVQILEDRGVALAAVTRAYPTVQIDGRQLRIENQISFVVRDEARGHRYSRLISHMPRPAHAWPIGSRVFYYMRPDNQHGHDWAVAKGRTSARMAPANESGIPGFPAVVHYLAGEPPPTCDPHIRPAERGDLEQCARLISSRYGEAPMFFPTSADRLAARLERGGFTDERQTWPHVYGWGDLYVYERDSRIVACAGFWDSGKNLREVWVHKRSGRRTVIENAALLDVGCEDGAEEALLGLIDHAMRLMNESGRNRLAIWLAREAQLLCALAERYTVTSETRALQCSLEDGAPPAALDRPFVDLAYW